MICRFALGSASSLALLLAAGTWSSIAAAEVPLPTGSYLKTCKIVSFDQATGGLAAHCEGKPVGMFGLSTPDTSRMNVQGCKEGTIWNDNRQLYCVSESAWGNDRVIPQGSYIDTCTDRKVVGGALLVAVCGTTGGMSRNASLDLRLCTWGKDISNSNGTLTCDRQFTIAGPGQAFGGGNNGQTNNGQTVVKPAAIDAEPVKPVLIAPLAPTEPSTTEEEEGRKKKKRHRDRREGGERG